MNHISYNNIFFIGIAGAGMSAIAQYLQGVGKNIRGSDRYFKENEPNEIRNKLEAAGITCFLQDGSGITEATELVVVSTAIEDTVYEVKKAKEMGIPILKRSELLAMIAESKKTIAVGGTSGKSTVTAMIYEIMDFAEMSPSIISGAGLTKLIKQGKIGNTAVGSGDWLIIEADESDGSIVQYKAEVGLLLNIEKDHQEMDELIRLFNEFEKNSQELFITNQSNPAAALISRDRDNDFEIGGHLPIGFRANDFNQSGYQISFMINGVPFMLKTLGQHNMENALAATAVTNKLGVSLEIASKALAQYEGIYRRHQIIGEKNGVVVIDDYAHNPAKCAASIRACQSVGEKLVAWFQPHGFKPTRFLRDEFIAEIAGALRDKDEIWMSEIFYAGGSAEKDISALELVEGIQMLGKKAHFVADRNAFVDTTRASLIPGTVLLLMGARDPSLEQFASDVIQKI